VNKKKCQKPIKILKTQKQKRFKPVNIKDVKNQIYAVKFRERGILYLIIWDGRKFHRTAFWILLVRL